MTPALRLQGVSKVYAGAVQAVSGLDLCVQCGDFFALLGPNGAGKSTTIGMIASLVNKSAGHISVFGHDLDREREAAKRCIGLVPQEFNFNTFEPLVEILTHQAGFYGIARTEGRRRAEHCLALLDLSDKRRAAPRELSGGMKRRLMIARALVHRPQLLILDEPTAGVDIEIRRATWSLLERLNGEGTTIILTTHYLEEAEALCRHVAIIDGGRVVEQGAVDALLSRAMAETFVFDTRPIAGALEGIELRERGYRIEQLSAERLEVEVPRGRALNRVFAALEARGVKVLSMRNKSNRLEEFFLRLVRENRRAGAPQ